MVRFQGQDVRVLDVVEDSIADVTRIGHHADLRIVLFKGKGDGFIRIVGKIEGRDPDVTRLYFLAGTRLHKPFVGKRRDLLHQGFKSPVGGIKRAASILEESLYTLDVIYVIVGNEDRVYVA